MTDLHEESALHRMQVTELARRDAAGIGTAYTNSKTVMVIIQAFIDRTATFGEGTTIWHYARVLAGVTIGRDCSIGGGAELGVNTIVGDATRIGAGVFLPPNSRVGSHVFIGPNVTCTDDRHPRAGNADYIAEPPVIEDYASIGAGAILLPGVHIGAHARVAAGAIVTRDVGPSEMVRGEPARVYDIPARWSA